MTSQHWWWTLPGLEPRVEVVFYDAEGHEVDDPDEPYTYHVTYEVGLDPVVLAYDECADDPADPFTWQITGRWWFAVANAEGEEIGSSEGEELFFDLGEAIAWAEEFAVVFEHEEGE